MVKKTVRKILNLGLGFSSIGQDKVKQLASELEKKYGISAGEGRKLAKDLINTTQRTSKQVVDAVSDQFQFVLENTLGVKKAGRAKTAKPRARGKKLKRRK